MRGTADRRLVSEGPGEVVEPGEVDPGLVLAVDPDAPVLEDPDPDLVDGEDDDAPTEAGGPPEPAGEDQDG